MLDLNDIIGNTPMIKINYCYNGKKKYVYAKLEFYNITGSIKDRVALYMIKNAEESGKLKKEMGIVEVTSGNTGIALAAAGKRFKHPVYIFMPDWVSKERVKLINQYGGKTFLYSKDDGGFLKCIKESQKFADEIEGFKIDQFSNYDNFLAHYETTGMEIVKQVPERIGAFISGVGTGGTLMGCGKRIKENYKDASIIAIEPDKMPIISEGKKISLHKIEGIGDEFVPKLIKKDEINKILLVNDDDAINMSKIISKELGLGVGISSGANFIGCVLANENIQPATVTVFADDNKKYMSTELFDPIDNNHKYISNKIKLINYEIV